MDHSGQRAGRLVFDVGLHRGEDTAYYLSRGFRVVAFEANGELVAGCRRRFAGPIAAGQLTIIEGAIVDRNHRGKKVRFYQNEGSLWGTVREAWAERNASLGLKSHVVEVAAVDFRDALQVYGTPYYLKIDIEGCDMACVQALHAFEERPDYVSIESDRLSIQGVRSELDEFVSLGYTSFQAIEQSSISRRSDGFEEGASGTFGDDLPPDDWMGRDQTLQRYRKIMLGYHLLGDNGSLNRVPTILGSWLRATARAYIRRSNGGNPVPGWYDTHARLDRNARP